MNLKKKFEIIIEALILTIIFIDTLFILISIFLPLKASTFNSIIYFDLSTSIILSIGYIFNILSGKSLKRGWNAFIIIIPFYFVGTHLFRVGHESMILRLLNFLKVAGLFIAARDLAAFINEFIEKSRLIYGLSFFSIVLLSCTIIFFMAEHGVNPGVETFEDALWYILQTLSTVGYGDIIPATQIGRITGIIVMISAIATTSLITASTTSSILEKLRDERKRITNKGKVEFKNIEKRLETIENTVESIMEEIKEIREKLE